MKKTIRKIYLCFIITILFTTGIALGNDTNLENKEYTEIYKKWLELSDEQKENVIEPSKYNFYSKDTKEEIQLANQKMNLKSLVKMAKSSTYATSPKFSLKTLIDNNLEIKDQKSTNFCWAFASISSLETNLALKNYNDNKDDKIYDYSERHMVYSMTQSFKDGQVNTNGWKQKAKDGGTTTMSMAYLTNGSGAINEEDMKFVDNQEEIDINDIKNKQVQTTVKDIRNFNSIYITKNDGAIDANKNKIKDSEIENLKEQIKEHISTSGSVKASIYMPNFDNNVHINLKSGAIYNLIDSYEDIKKEMTKKDGVYVNHAVSIIGWDDNYSKDNFSTKPKNNGAWIIRNSYGKTIEMPMEQLRKNNPGLEDEEIVSAFSASMNCNCTLSEDGQILNVSVGDNGIFYVSYEDAYIYSDLLGIENAEDKKDYDNLYQYDNLGGGEVGYIKGNDVKDIFLANVFTRTKTDTEYLTSIGFQSLVEGTYEVYINPDGTDKSLSNLQKAELTTGEEISLTAGYHTINFKKAYKLKENNFVVAIKMKHKDGGISYFTYEAKEENPDIVLSKAKESFVVREEQAQKDSQWLDIGDSSSSSYLGNLCIKGITVNQYSGSIANEEEKEDSKTDNNNSNYDKAKAELQEIKLEGNNQGSSVNIKIKVTGIEVKNSSEKYQHYFYLSSNSKENNIQEDKWIPAGKFEKQDDGTYINTGTRYNPAGFGKDRKHIITRTIDDLRGFDIDGKCWWNNNRQYDKAGFRQDGTYKDTGELYHEGYNAFGLDENGKNRQGKIPNEIIFTREYILNGVTKGKAKEILNKYGVKNRSSLNLSLYKASEMCPQIKTLLCEQITKYQMMIKQREEKIKQLENEKTENKDLLEKLKKENAILRNRINLMNPMQDLDK